MSTPFPFVRLKRLRMILGDLTKAHAGSINSVVRKIPLQSDELKRDLVLVINPHQRQEVVGLVCKEVLEIQGSNGDAGEALYAEIKARISVANNRPVHVFTFSNFVLRLHERFSPEEKSFFAIRTWARVYELGQTVPRPAKVYSTAWNIPSISEDEAVAVLVKALESKKAISSASGVIKTFVRPLIAEIDSRLSSAATQGCTGVVSNLIAAAIKVGVIEVEVAPENPSHTKIWLKKHKVESVASEQYIPREDVSREGYQQTLRDNQMGAFPNFREDVYEQMQLLVASVEKLSVGNFVRKAVQGVAQKHSSEHKRFSFTPVQNFIMTLMKNAPVLKSENGELLTPSFSDMSKLVASLAENWKERLDGEIVLCLLRSGCDISMYDIPALTGAMYPTRDSENQEKVQKVIELLKNESKIDYAGDLLKIC